MSKQKQMVTLDGLDFEIYSKQCPSNRIFSRLTHRFGNGLRFVINTYAIIGSSNFTGNACIFRTNRKLFEYSFDSNSDVGETFTLMKARAHASAILEFQIQQDILDATK